ncbi:MAG TPA: hypothetical protein VKT30_10220 [Caulobacteraceae bacterium]|nr:hypothetical protein [Caulobacteraceae bacterium]
MSLVGELAESVLRGAVRKAAQGFVAKGEITPAQAAQLVDGVMVEIQLALAMWEAGQKPATAAR